MAARAHDLAETSRNSRSPEQIAFLQIQKTADALMKDVTDVLKPARLSPTQYNVLRILRGAGAAGLACGKIADRMITREPDMTRLLDRLEKRQLIRRGRDTADRRVVRARITGNGLNVLAGLDKPVVAAHKRQLGHLGRRRLQELIRLLGDVRR